MSLSLPITFSALADVFEDKKIASRLMTEIEAWLNFETMKKSWYGDERYVLSVTSYLLTSAKFDSFTKTIDDNAEVIAQQADFVIYIKPSAAEHSANLSRPPKITALFIAPDIEAQQHDKAHIEQVLRTKLVEMMNLIAEHQSLDMISLD